MHREAVYFHLSDHRSSKVVFESPVWTKYELSRVEESNYNFWTDFKSNGQWVYWHFPQRQKQNSAKKLPLIQVGSATEADDLEGCTSPGVCCTVSAMPRPSHAVSRQKSLRSAQMWAGISCVWLQKIISTNPLLTLPVSIAHTLEDMLGLKWIIVDHFFIPITELSSLFQTGLGQDFKSYPAIKHGLLGSCLCGEIKVISPSICSSIWFKNLNGKLTFQKCYFFLLIKSTSRRKMWNDWGFSTLKFFHSENEDLNISYPSIKFVNSFCRETHNNKNWLFVLMFSQISI